MIIYNQTWLHNLLIRNKAKLWFFQGFISDPEKEKISEARPVGFYMPGFWMALGLFFFTTILLSASVGFISFVVLTTEIKEEFAFQIVNFVFSGGCIFFAEQYKREKHYYNAGTDNALVWAGIGSFIGNLFWILFEICFPEESVWILGFFLAMVICTIGTIRYSDVFIALCAFICGLISLFFFLGNFGTIGKAIIPFVGFSYSAGVYAFLRLKISSEHKIFYNECLAIVEAAALISAYISVNYFVVRELSIEMFDLTLAESQDIPFGFIFMFLTVTLPPAYIYLSLKFKNRIMLRIGFLLVAVSIFTIRYYHTFLPIEIAMIVGGAILIGGAYFILQWLKTPKFGFSTKEEVEYSGYKIAESLIVAQTFSPTPSSADGNQFGGGSFGGGGSGDSF